MVRSRIERKTSLKRGRPLYGNRHSLTRKTGTLKNRVPLKRTPFRPKRKKDDIPALIRMQVSERSGGRCERILENGERCWRAACHKHHKLARSQGGLHTVENIADLCAPCHFLCKSEPKKMMAEGLVLLASNLTTVL